MTTVTSTHATYQQETKELPAKEAVTWLKEGWLLFTKAPFKLLGLSFLMLLTAGLIQALAGPVGLGISKWVSPILATLLFHVCALLLISGCFDNRPRNETQHYKNSVELKIIKMEMQ